MHYVVHIKTYKLYYNDISFMFDHFIALEKKIKILVIQLQISQYHFYTVISIEFYFFIHIIQFNEFRFHFIISETDFISFFERETRLCSIKL